MIDLINLPRPSPLLPSLLKAGFSHEIATAADRAYAQRAEEFRRRTETTLISTWQKMTTFPNLSTSSPDHLTGKYISAFTEVYLRHLEEWKEEMVQLLRQASKAPSKADLSKCPRAFNHEYVPLLEHFFKENAFPTHADKVFLAKKSNMQYRQIHVWFQNRRNRTKKEGKSLKKKPMTGDTLGTFSGKLHEDTKGHVAMSVSQPLRPVQVSSSGVGNEMRTDQNTAQCVFILPRPPHAFPSPFPPTCTYNPFPCKESVSTSFGKPEWRRMPCSKPPSSVSINLDNLVKEFSLLNVRGECTKGSRPQSHAATAAITVRPSRAPHPSLIIHEHPRISRVPVQRPVRAPIPRSHVFQTPSPTSRPVTLVPHSVTSCSWELPIRCRTAKSLQRVRGGFRNDERDTTPSECSSTSS